MASNLTKTRFEDLLLEPVRNGIYKKKEFHGRGAKIVNMGELFRYPRLTDVEMKRVELTSNEVPKVLLQNGDLLFARRSLTAEGARKCSIVREVNEPTTFESSIIRARPNPALADSDFLYYLYSSEIGYNLLDTIRRSVAVSGITGGDLKNLELDVPPLPEQKAIAHILGSLDDKIELNRRMNATLEGMAQALFKSWFVDFDPVIDNALAAGNPIPDELAARAEVRSQALADGTANREAAKPFPAAFQETESMGWIPEGWEVSHMVENVRLTMGQSPSSEHYNTEGNGLPFHQGVTNYGERFPSHEQYSTGGNRHAEEGDILFSVRAPVGRINIANCQLIIGRGLSSLRHKKDCQGFLVYFLKHTFAKEDSIGSGTIFNAVNKKEMERIPFIVPPDETTKAFNDIANSLDEKIASNAERTENLTKLRDTLLPKLISGELAV